NLWGGSGCEREVGRQRASVGGNDLSRHGPIAESDGERSVRKLGRSLLSELQDDDFTRASFKGLTRGQGHRQPDPSARRLIVADEQLRAARVTTSIRGYEPPFRRIEEQAEAQRIFGAARVQ